VVQWLKLYSSIAVSAASLPAQGTKIPHATWYNPHTQKNHDIVEMMAHDFQGKIRKKTLWFALFLESLSLVKTSCHVMVMRTRK